MGNPPDKDVAQPCLCAGSLVHLFSAVSNFVEKQRGDWGVVSGDVFGSVSWHN